MSLEGLQGQARPSLRCRGALAVFTSSMRSQLKLRCIPCDIEPELNKNVKWNSPTKLKMTPPGCGVQDAAGSIDREWQNLRPVKWTVINNLTAESFVWQVLICGDATWSMPPNVPS
ncbi:MAG: hypothetical protein FRX49_02234 [Trebouxia sp. A1-2]|nr:MAG: hypothetical protein FRX49_02234 [Trebouxia sp. A1-2]